MNDKRTGKFHVILLSEVLSITDKTQTAIWHPDFKAQTPANPLPLTSDMLSNAKPESPKGKQS